MNTVAQLHLIVSMITVTLLSIVCYLDLSRQQSRRASLITATLSWIIGTGLTFYYYYTFFAFG